MSTDFAKYFSSAQIERAKQIAARSVGCKVNIRVDRNTRIVGIIDSAELGYVGFTGRSAQMVWSVDVLCGANQTRRNFKLSTLPQS